MRAPCRANHRNRRGSVLIIVLWTAFGLVSLALYFAHSTSLELRAADHRVAGIEAEQAIAGAARYVSNILAAAQTPGTLPDALSYQREAVPVAEAAFWLIGRDTNDWQSGLTQPVFGLVDEASKLNLNIATVRMLEALPRMTPELAAAIIDWRDADSSVTAGGAEEETYARLNPARRCKNAPFESLEELRLVFGMDLVTLYGEDRNLNGILDPNEDDGDVWSPAENRDGRLDAGLVEYATIYSREPNTRSDGSPRVNVNASNQRDLASLLREKFSAERANQILARIPPGVSLRSVVEFYVRSRMTADEFAQISSDITVTNSAFIDGLINVNTASEVVLACIPGIGTDKASSLVAYRQSNPDRLTSVAWVVEALGQDDALRAGPSLTTRSYQFTADVAALGHHGRGYRRVKFVFDTSEGAARIAYRQDLTHLGWALGKDVRNTLLLAQETRR